MFLAASEGGGGGGDLVLGCQNSAPYTCPPLLCTPGGSRLEFPQPSALAALKRRPTDSAQRSGNEQEHGTRCHQPLRRASSRSTQSVNTAGVAPAQPVMHDWSCPSPALKPRTADWSCPSPALDARLEAGVAPTPSPGGGATTPNLIGQRNQQPEPQDARSRCWR